MPIKQNKNIHILSENNDRDKEISWGGGDIQNVTVQVSPLAYLCVHKKVGGCLQCVLWF